MVFAQNKTCVELFASLTRQSFEDGRSPGGYQITDIIFREMYAADFTKHVEATAFMPALSDFGINAHTFVTTFRAVVGGVRLLHLWSKGKEFLANCFHV